MIAGTSTSGRSMSTSGKETTASPNGLLSSSPPPNSVGLRNRKLDALQNDSIAKVGKAMS